MAFISTSVFGGLLAAFAYLTFFFPRVMRAWEDQGAALSSLQIVLVKMATFCASNVYFLLLPLVGGFLVSMVFLFRKGDSA